METFALSDRDQKPRRVKGQGMDGIGVSVEVNVVRSEPRERDLRPSHDGRLHSAES